LLFETTFNYAKNIKLPEVSVFRISDKAVEMAKMFMIEESKEGWGLRIYKAGESCCGPSFGLDLLENPEAGDEIVEKNGLRVFIGKDTVESLSEMSMDYMEDEDKAGFVLNGGKTSSCGSGAADCSSCG
jgi:iron-sulfur cluster assembly accessory protein